VTLSWPRTRLKYVTDCNVAVLPETTHDEEEFVYIDVGNVTQGGMRTSVPPIRFCDAPSRARRLAHPRDTVVSTVRTYLRAIAMVPESSRRLVFSTGFAVLHPRGCVDPEFLSWYLQGDEFVSRIEANSTGVSYPAITASRLVSLDVRLPPFEVQQAIATFLDRETVQIDRIIAQQERLIELLHERRRSVVASLIVERPPQTVGLRLKHVMLDVRQGWSPQCYPWPADGVETWGILKAGAANGGIFRPEENKQLPESEAPRPELVVRSGDLVVSRANTRELLGSAAVVEREYPRLMLCDKLYAFSLDRRRADPRFVAFLLGTRRLRDLIEIEATGSSPSMQNISLREIVNLPMDLPGIDDQHRVLEAIDALTSKIDNLIAEAERFIELARERRSALITAAVTGQIDVRTFA
jgi:type I restriction enzyme, S subunit